MFLLLMCVFIANRVVNFILNCDKSLKLNLHMLADTQEYHSRCIVIQYNKLYTYLHKWYTLYWVNKALTHSPQIPCHILPTHILKSLPDHYAHSKPTKAETKGRGGDDVLLTTRPGPLPLLFPSKHRACLTFLNFSHMLFIQFHHRSHLTARSAGK